MKMKKNNLLRYWPITLILAGIALMAVLIVSSTPALASSDGRSALQETLPPATVPPATLPAPTVIIPETGGDTIIVDFFSSWLFWVIVGILLIGTLVALFGRQRRTDIHDVHHHHDL